MFLIGLTGGIASGKSTVSRMLAEKGAMVIDADLLAREVVEPGLPAWQDIVDWLGSDILLPDRRLNRSRLAEKVFRDRRMLEKLNTIVHPRVEERFQELLRDISAEAQDAVVVYDVPLLAEVGMADIFDLVLLVYLKPELQFERLCLRDRLSDSDAWLRLNAQMDMEKKKKLADYVIDNSGTPEETADQVDRFWSQVIGEKNK